MDVLGCCISSVISLSVGLLQSDFFLSTINAVLASMGMQNSGFAWAVSYVVVVAMDTGVVVTLVWIVMGLKRRIAWGRRRKLRHMDAVCYHIKEYLRVLADELECENEFDDRALSQLRALVDDCESFVRQNLTHPSFIDAEGFAQRLWALREAMKQHTETEIALPLHQGPWVSKDLTKAQRDRSQTGIDCVRRLCFQLNEEAARHPVGKGRSVP